MKLYKINMDELVMNHIYSYYVKYDKLHRLINQLYGGSSANTINIFIDIMDIYKSLESKLREPFANHIVIISGIINMVAHYRQFFKSRYNVYSNFWLISSEDNYLAREYCEEFVPIRLNPLMQNIYNTSMEFLPMICKYIPDVDFIRTSVNFSTKVMSILEYEDLHRKNINPSLVITKDLLAYAGASIAPILRPKKNPNGDYSYIISYDNFHRFVWDMQKKEFDTSMLHNDGYFMTIPMLAALTRLPSRSLSRILSMKKALDIMYTVSTEMHSISANKIITDPLGIYLEHVYKYTGIDIARVQNRFLACEILNQYVNYMITPECKSYQGIVNLYDPEGIKRINNEFFSTCPLDLNVL